MTFISQCGESEGEDRRCCLCRCYRLGLLPVGCRGFRDSVLEECAAVYRGRWCRTRRDCCRGHWRLFLRQSFSKVIAHGARDRSHCVQLCLCCFHVLLEALLIHTSISSLRSLDLSTLYDATSSESSGPEALLSSVVKKLEHSRNSTACNTLDSAPLRLVRSSARLLAREIDVI